MTALSQTTIHPGRDAPDQSAASLELRDVGLRYQTPDGGSVTALHQVSFTIEPGDFVVALGASGCGKTSLLNLMAGFQAPGSGSLSLGGQTIRGPGAERGVVFQNDALYPWLSVVDNVAFALRLRGISKSERRERARAMLDLVGLGGFASHAIWQISGGMRQRVGLARALAADPQVLLMDEPLGALDAMTREQMQELLLEVWSRTGKSIFLITHGIEEAVFFATRLLVMSPRPGRIIADRTLDFGQRVAAGASARAVKASPDFIAAREEIRDLVFAASSPDTAPTGRAH